MTSSKKFKAAALGSREDREILASLAELDVETLCRIAVASSSRVVLSTLAENTSVAVRRKVAGNQFTSSKTLLVLSGDKIPEVCLEVARNRSATSESLEMLSKHEMRAVRFAVIAHENASFKMVERMTFDIEGGVNEAARDKVDALLHRQSRGRIYYFG